MRPIRRIHTRPLSDVYIHRTDTFWAAERFDLRNIDVTLVQRDDVT